MLGRKRRDAEAAAGGLRAAGGRPGQPGTGYRCRQFNHRGHREHRGTKKG